MVSKRVSLLKLSMVRLRTRAVNIASASACPLLARKTIGLMFVVREKLTSWQTLFFQTSKMPRVASNRLKSWCKKLTSRGRTSLASRKTKVERLGELGTDHGESSGTDKETRVHFLDLPNLQHVAVREIEENTALPVIRSLPKEKALHELVMDEFSQGEATTEWFCPTLLPGYIDTSPEKTLRRKTTPDLCYVYPEFRIPPRLESGSAELSRSRHGGVISADEEGCSVFQSEDEVFEFFELPAEPTSATDEDPLPGEFSCFSCDLDRNRQTHTPIPPPHTIHPWAHP